MNIITLVFSFLLILSLSSALIVKERILTAVEARHYHGYMNAHKSLRNELEESQLQELTELNSSTDKSSSAQNPPNFPSAKMQTKADFPSSPKSQTQKSREKFEKRQAFRRSCDYSKFNLHTLFSPSPSPLALQTAEKLLLILYGDAPFFPNEPQQKAALASSLLKELLAIASKQKEITSFDQLVERSSPYYSLLFKMVKGTNSYNVEKRAGYPPLEDFFLIDSTEKKAVLFHYASLPLLEALLGKEAAKEVPLIERNKFEQFSSYPFLTIEECNQLIDKKAGARKELSAIAEIVSFKKINPTRSILQAHDTKSNISVRKRL